MYVEGAAEASIAPVIVKKTRPKVWASSASSEEETEKARLDRGHMPP
jgi:hypothetical protein